MSLLDIWRSLVDRPSAPDVLLVAPGPYAIMEAHRLFHGRNWRRVKREVNKAIKRVRKEQRGKSFGSGVIPQWPC